MNTRYPAGSGAKQLSSLEKFSLFFINKKSQYVGNTRGKNSRLCGVPVNEIIFSI